MSTPYELPDVDPDRLKSCNQCRWSYFPRLENDPGVCGTCGRELGIYPSSPETKELDRLIRLAQGLDPKREEVTP